MGNQKIKLVVIDDELVARINVKNLLSGDKVYEIVADFGDAFTALEWFENNEADIVLMDMNMPKVNGVELINMICSMNSNICFLAISGYEDFEYVRGCLKNENVSDYLLKHQLTREKLICALDDIKKKYKLRTHEINQSQDELIYRIFETQTLNANEIKEISKEQDIHFEYSDMVMFYFSPDMKHIPKDAGQFKLNVSMVMENIIQQVIKGNYQYMLYKPNGKDIALLVSFANIRSYQYILNTETVMIQRIQNMASNFLNITVTIWIGKIQSKLSAAISEYHYFQNEAIEKLYGEPGHVYFSVQSKEKMVRKSFLLSEEEEKQFRKEIVLGNEETVYEHIKDLFSRLKENKSPRFDVVAVCRKLMDIMEESYFEMIHEQKSVILLKLDEQDFIDQYQQLIWNVLQKILQKKSGTLKQKYDPAVANAITYIQTHFKEDITLETCAKSIGISYTHMSRLFKKETGVKFTEYLNKIRIDYAKILIEQEKSSLKEIVEQSGFTNYNYFFKVFRELEGITPSEYNKHCKNRE